MKNTDRKQPWYLSCLQPRIVRLTLLSLTALLLVVVALNVLVATHWSGDARNVVITFVVMDLDSGEPIENAAVTLYSELSRSTQVLHTGKDGHAKLIISLSSGGTTSIFGTTFSVNLLGWYFWGTAEGYDATEPTYLSEYRDKVRQREDYSYLSGQVSAKKKA